MNTARDLGTRMVAAIFFGREAFTYMNYCWIGILVNIPAYILGAAYYEYIFRDSLQRIDAGHAKHEHGDDGLMRHSSNIGALVSERGMATFMPQKIDVEH